MAIALILGLVFLGLVALAAVFAFRPRKKAATRVRSKAAAAPLTPATPRHDPDLTPTEAPDPDATGLPASVRNTRPQRSLFEVAAEGDVAGMKALLTGTGSLSRLGQLDERGWTALHHAAYHDRVEAVRWLLQEGADVDAVAEGECVPLHMAGARGGVGVVTALLKGGADPLKTDDQGATALHYAMRSDRVTVAQALVEGKVPVDFKDVSHLTALDRARLEGLTDLVAFLTERGARSGEAVRMADVLASLGAAGDVVPVPEGWQLQPDSPQLVQAQKLAQESLSRLLEAFEGEASPRAAVRFVLKEDEVEELVWGTVKAVGAGQLGVVLQAPPLVVSMPDGEIQVDHAEVVDWQLLSDAGTIGGFGEWATGEAMKAEYGRMAPALEARLAQRVEV